MADWRAMTEADLPAVTAISQAVHGDYAEPIEIYAERLALYPDGCFVFDREGYVQGLLVSHPWDRAEPPALGAMLGAIPHTADLYYLHDIALLPATRGVGAGAGALELVLAAARRAGCAEIALVAVNGADRYWAANGFDRVEDARGYGPGTHVMRRAVV